nr:DMT family transporter [uncultured Cohaesibacter sp.]
MSQSATLGAIVALVVGIVIAFQAILSARVSVADNAASTGLVMYVAGGFIAVSLLAIFYSTGSLTVAHLSWSRVFLMLAGGLAGVIIVSGSAFAFSRVNPAAAVALVVFGQMAIALLADYLGLAGHEPTPIDWRRLFGLVLFSAAIWLLTTPSKD